MAMTIIEKILARAAGRDHVEVGEFVVCEVDMTVLIDLQFATMWVSPTRIHDPRQLAVIMDHAVPAPSVVRRGRRCPGPRVRRHARHRAVLRRRAARHLPPGDLRERPRAPRRDPDLHRLTHMRRAAPTTRPRAGSARPRSTRSCAPARPGSRWRRPIRYELVGHKPDGVTGKDIFLHIAGTCGDATNHNLEFGGPGLESVPMNDRRTIATQGAEMSADFTTFPADELCREFLDAHCGRPYTAADADPDAILRGRARSRPLDARAVRGPARRGRRTTRSRSRRSSSGPSTSASSAPAPTASLRICASPPTCSAASRSPAGYG